MKRILFVDDEPSILDGLRRMLRPFRSEWEMTFATSGPQALELAQATSFDVVVTDMRMPQMSGSELLAKFQKLSPGTVRIVLSGHAELESTMRAVPVAHQFLSKPCDAALLKEVVTRATALQALLDDESLRRLVGQIDGLPARPESYARILQALADPNVSIAQIADILRSDVAMSAKLLQLVNSSFFGLGRRIADIHEAVRYLGLHMVRDLVLSIEVFQPPPEGSVSLQRVLGALQNRSMQTALLAMRIVEDRQLANSAFTAGLLHDVGLLIAATRLSEPFEAAIRLARESGEPLHQAEKKVYGVSHAELGAYLLGLWGLPYPILEAAAYHNTPASLPHDRSCELTAVHVAVTLVDSHVRPELKLLGADAVLDTDYLQKLGISESMESWESIADNLFGAQ